MSEGNAYGERSASIQNVAVNDVSDQDFDNKSKQEDPNSKRHAYISTTLQNTQNNTRITQCTHTDSKSRHNNHELEQNNHEFTFDQMNNTNADDTNTMAINRSNQSRHDSVMLSKQSKQSRKTRQTNKDISSGKLSNQGRILDNSAAVRKCLDQRCNLAESDERRDLVKHYESEMLDDVVEFQTNAHGSNIQPGLRVVE